MRILAINQNQSNSEYNVVRFLKNNVSSICRLFCTLSALQQEGYGGIKSQKFLL